MTTGATEQQSKIDAAPPARRSTWTTRQKIARVLWETAGRVVWRLVPALRCSLIRWFGGTVGRGCTFAGSSTITIPWHMTVGDDVEVGADVILYSLGMITLGKGVVIDYAAHLCAGTHDMRDPRFPLLRTPITIGAKTFIGIDTFIGPGVAIGDRCRVWPRTSVYRSCESDQELHGNPARVVGASTE